jgi:hypothetical protein
MVVHHVYLLRLAVLPDETDPILVVDPDAVLPLSISGKSLETIAGKCPEVVQALGGVQLGQLPLRDLGNGPKPSRRVPLEQGLGVTAPERADHGTRL